MAVSDNHAGFAAAEAAYKQFISDPERLRQGAARRWPHCVTRHPQRNWMH